MKENINTARLLLSKSQVTPDGMLLRGWLVGAMGNESGLQMEKV